MILAIGPADDVVRERLTRFGSVVEVAADDQEAIARHLEEAVAIAARATAVVDAAVIDAAPRLRVIGRSGVGVDLVDLSAATARGIPVVITPSAGTRAVAEGTFALMLHLLKRLGPLTVLVREGRWAKREQVIVRDLDGATLGIVGYGRIGRRVAELAVAFGMRVVAHDPFVDSSLESDVQLVEFDELLATADALTLHAPLTPDTKGLIGEHQLSLIKPGAVLVNCGRGGLLDLDAALAALDAGRLSGVGLDVYDPEPAAHHPLFDHADVVLTPHVMALSQRARRLVFADMADGIAAVLDGRRAPNIANPAVYE
jgi:D-3-phosphoglycerate dehydrogenase